MESPFPPFDPDGEEQAPRSDDPSAIRLRDIPLRTIFPNFLTLLAICSGLTAIRFAVDGRVELAVAAIIFAAFLDGIDGRVARFFKSTTRFGAQMDSLADFVNFGVAPAMLLYYIFLNEMNSLGWIVVLLYASCACLRLARFNVMLDDPNAPDWQYRFFVGVPAPAGALLALLPVYLKLLGVETSALFNWATIAFTLFCGFLMISNLPTYSGKDISEKVRTDLVMPLMILVVVLTAAIFSYPWLVLTILAMLYFVSIPLAIRKHQALVAQDDQPES